MLTKEFVTAGRAVFTLDIPAAFAERLGTPPHYTFKVNKAKYGDTLFVSLLTGPNNTTDFTYLGLLTEQGEVKLTKKSQYVDESAPVKLIRRVIANVWCGTCDAIAAAGFNLHHEGRCGRCGRTLTVPESVRTGLGPECAGRI